MARAIFGLSVVEGKLSRYLENKTDAIVEAARMTQSLIANSARKIVPVRTGALQRSIQEGRVELNRTTVTAYVYALQNYADFVERGTSRMKKRPYLGPSFEKHKQDYIRLLMRVMKP